MSERKNVTIEVHSWDESFAVSASDFLTQVAGLIEIVPIEYRAEIVFEFDRRGSDYDSSYGELSMHYTRPETDDEIRSREQSHEQYQAREHARERATYEALKRKFEPH